MRAFSKLNIFGYFIVEFVAVSLGDGVGGKILFYVFIHFLFVLFLDFLWTDGRTFGRDGRDGLDGRLL